MTIKIDREYWALIFGASTLILFATKPYILDLIEPAQSIGQVIGENAKDIIDSINGKKKIESSNSQRENWSNLLTILSLVLFAATIILSATSIQTGPKKWYSIAAGFLAMTGIAIYIFQLAIGIIGFGLIAILVVMVVLNSG